MQDHPGAQKTLEGSTRTVVPAARGGAAAHHMAPGHDSLPAVPSSAARHDRPRAVPKAPDRDRSRARHQRAPDHDRSRAAHRAPPGRALVSAGTSVPIATAPSPARASRLLQVFLLRVAATPHAPIYPQSRHTAAKNRAAYSHAPTYPLSRSTTYPVHPPITVPTLPSPRSAEDTGFPPQCHSRAPPTAARRNAPPVCDPPAPLHHVERGRGVRLTPAPIARTPTVTRRNTYPCQGVRPAAAYRAVTVICCTPLLP